MEEEKTLAIPLGGITADGETVTPTAGPVESAASDSARSERTEGSRQKSAKAIVKSDGEAFDVSGTPFSQPEEPKKPSVAVKVFKAFGALIIFLLVVAVIGGGILFFLATRDEMPSAPEIKTDMKTVAVDSAMEALKEKEIRLNSDEINLFLDTIKEKSAEKAAEHGVEIVALFSVIAGDKATFYSRIKYKGITWPVKAVAKVSFDDPNILISIEKANIGSLDLPTKKIVEFVGNYIVNDNLSVMNGMIYYDTTEFNDQITEVTIKQLGLEVDKSDEEHKGWWDKVKDWFKEKTANIVSDIIHDLKFKNVTVIDNELVITVTYAED